MPSICLYMTWSKMKNNSYAAEVKSSLTSLQSKLWIVLVSQNKSSIQISITSFKRILVNKLSTYQDWPSNGQDNRNFVSIHI